MDKLKQLIEQSSRILITSHISPDPDAVSSALLLAQTLKTNYNQKQINLVLEERPNKDLSFLAGFSDIEFTNLAEAAKTYKPELLIIVDANRWDRVSRDNASELSHFVASSDVKTAIIDHHEPRDKDSSDIYLNNGYPASVQEIYELCFVNWKLQKPAGWAQTAMLGLLTDTFRFKYKNPRYRDTFLLAGDLIEGGADIEELDNMLEHYEPGELTVLAELSANLVSGPGYNYSFANDEFAEAWRALDKQGDFKSACELFTNQFLRNVGDNKWGFLLKPDVEDGPGHYSVSFRAESGARDVSAVAAHLGGGGHKPSAGARFQAESLQAALDLVKQAIEKTAGV